MSISKLTTFITSVNNFAANVSAFVKLFSEDYNSRRIVIEVNQIDVLFDWAKRPDNNSANLSEKEVVSNGRISNSVHIFSAVYNGTGDVGDFGTEENGFNDGNYTNVVFGKYLVTVGNPGSGF